jgi:hypothetical protein
MALGNLTIKLRLDMLSLIKASLLVQVDNPLSPKCIWELATQNDFKSDIFVVFTPNNQLASLCLNVLFIFQLKWSSEI